MADNWQVLPPWTSEQGPTNISVGSNVKQNFNIVKHSPEFESEMSSSFHWTGLSHEDIANLRNLAYSDGLRNLTQSYGYGTGTGLKMTTQSGLDSDGAEFYLTIYSKEDIPESVLSEITSFVKKYKVQRFSL